jgi:hypothetical protein
MRGKPPRILVTKRQAKKLQKDIMEEYGYKLPFLAAKHAAEETGYTAPYCQMMFSGAAPMPYSFYRLAMIILVGPDPGKPNN